MTCRERSPRRWRVHLYLPWLYAGNPLRTHTCGSRSARVYTRGGAKHSNQAILYWFDLHPPQYISLNCSPIYLQVADNLQQTRISRLLAWKCGTIGAFKLGQHAAWPALFRQAHTGLEGLGGIICPAEWRPRHSVAPI